MFRFISRMKSYCCICLILLTKSLFAQQWLTTGITDSVISVCAQEHLIWAATSNDGIKSFDKQTGAIEVYNTTNGAVATNDFRVVKYFNGRIYAGAFFGGYYIFEDNVWTHYDTTNSILPGMNVTDIEFNPAENIVWVATDGGLVKIVDDTWEVIDSLNSDLAGTVLTCLLYDAHDQLWIGTRYNGLSKYVDGVYTTYNYDNSGISDNMIRTLASDSEGNLFVADYYGVGLYNPFTDVWEYVFNTETSGLTSNRVNRMVFDHNDHLWFVSHDGVTHWDLQYFYQYYSTNSPLPHNTTDGLCVDDENIIWIGSFGGLTGYNENNVTLPAYESELVVYPNPFKDILHAEIKNGDRITVTDLYGQMIYDEIVDENLVGVFYAEIDLSPVERGIYLISVFNGSGHLIRKIIKL